MRTLVTGGAGYIGSFMVRRLLAEGNEVVVADSLEIGRREAVDSRAKLVVGNILDKKFIEELFSQNKFDAVLHFAAYISMAQSMEKPGMYFRNNTGSTFNLLEAMARFGPKLFIFSSTAGVYGNPVKLPISEDHPKDPTNPYGESKLMSERLLYWYGQIHSINSVCLRYFNAAGAALDGSLGKDVESTETHIIPNAIKAALKKQPFSLFGTDYPTKDGTCVRDYIHVLDLVEAHILALKKLKKDGGVLTYNVGTGRGHTNGEVIEIVKKIGGIDFEVKEEGRRPGDATELVADPQKIEKELGFKPRYSDLETIVKTAWGWYDKNLK